MGLDELKKQIQDKKAEEPDPSEEVTVEQEPDPKPESKETEDDSDSLKKELGDQRPPVVEKKIGAPGTGKTTEVVGNPELEIRGLILQEMENYSIEEQMLVTYTKAGVEEAQDRLYQMTELPKYKIEDRVRTIHSSCYNLLNNDPRFAGLDREQVVQFWHKQNFCEENGLEFGYDNDEDDIMGADMEEGNLLFRIYGWLQSNRKDVSEWQDCPADWDGEDDCERLLKKWDEYKDRKNLVGFGDMIEETLELGFEQLDNLGWGVLFPNENTTTKEMFEAALEDDRRDPSVIRGTGAFVDTKVLYVDEVQDLTPLQWEWYMMQKLVCDKVYLGGDDDQSIYGWAGANPEFMLNEEGDVKVLDRTYRIPENIWNVCDGVIQQVDVRQEKDVTPDGEGGEFIPMMKPSPRQIMAHVKEGETMILFRANYMVNEFTDHLHEYGIPYRNMSTFDLWDEDLMLVAKAFEKLENGDDKISGDELQALIDKAEDHMLDGSENFSTTEMVMGSLGGVSVDRVKEVLNIPSQRLSGEVTMQSFIEATDELNYYEGEAIKGVVHNGNTDMDPDRVRIGTIHSSKGKEAETVILSTDSTSTIIENMLLDQNIDPMTAGNRIPLSDEERRVYYVGMTRASEKLVMAQGVVNPDASLNIRDIISEEHYEMYRDELEGVQSSSWER